MTNVVVYALTHGSISDYSDYIPESVLTEESTSETAHLPLQGSVVSSSDLLGLLCSTQSIFPLSDLNIAPWENRVLRYQRDLFLTVFVKHVIINIQRIVVKGERY